MFVFTRTHATTTQRRGWHENWEGRLGIGPRWLLQSQATGGTDDAQRAPTTPGEDLPSPRPPYPYLLILLLVIVCLTSLGSLQLPGVRHLLASDNSLPTRTTPPGGNQSPPGLESPPALQHFYPQPPPDQEGSRSALKQTLAATGRTATDLAYAKSAAEMFVVLYKTVDVNVPATFEACVTLLSDGAIRRFYGHQRGVPPNVREQRSWRATQQQHHLRQYATAKPAHFLLLTTVRGQHIAWFTIAFLLTTEQDGAQTTQMGSYTVAALAVPLGGSGPGDEWKISAWRPGSTVFPLLFPL